MTPPRSRWSRSAAGGTPAAASDYPDARRLLITADAGGSNGYRTRAWKAELAALAAETGLEITVCHFPPGTSKWNKIEHRLFSHITMNWRGRPLTSHDVVINSIAATTTRTGLTVQARLDDGTYPTGVKVTNAQMAALPVSRHPFHGDWNYTLHPAARPAATAARQHRPGTAGPREPALPELTGLATAEMDELIAQLAALRQAQREQRARSHPASDARHKPRSGRPPALPLPRPRRGHRAPPAPEPARRHPRPPVRHQPHHDRGEPSPRSGTCWTSTGTASSRSPPRQACPRASRHMSPGRTATLRTRSRKRVNYLRALSARAAAAYGSGPPGANHRPRAPRADNPRRSHRPQPRSPYSPPPSLACGQPGQKQIANQVRHVGPLTGMRGRIRRPEQVPDLSVRSHQARSQMARPSRSAVSALTVVRRGHGP